MRAKARSILVALAFLIVSEKSALADRMDPALNRLIMDDGCIASGADGTGQYYNPQSGFTRCTLDNAAFAKLVAQYGFAIAPTAMHTARTTGFGGFEFALEAAFTKIDSDADYMHTGTQGPQDQTSKDFSIRNPDPDGFLQAYSIKATKGFPLGLELTANVGYVAHTSLVMGGADVRWSLLEGFRKGIPAIFPDFALGASVRTTTGTDQLDLTVAGADAQISKQIPISGVVVLTPYVGYQWIRIFGDSGLIDLTPNTDAVNYCGYAGANEPATPDPNKPYYDGQPVCTTGSSADFNNTAVFESVRLTRHRLDFGIQGRAQMVKWTTHFITDLVSAEDANQGSDYESLTSDTSDAEDAKENSFKGMPKQWTIAVDLGVVF